MRIGCDVLATPLTPIPTALSILDVKNELCERWFFSHHSYIVIQNSQELSIRLQGHLVDSQRLIVFAIQISRALRSSFTCFFPEPCIIMNESTTSNESYCKATAGCVTSDGQKLVSIIPQTVNCGVYS